jgi:hypothetical protein
LLVERISKQGGGIAMTDYSAAQSETFKIGGDLEVNRLTAVSAFSAMRRGSRKLGK